MTQKKIQKIAQLAGFATIALCSTWATEASLTRLLSWPGYFLWPLSLILFCTASYGVNRVILAFDYSEMRHGRTWYFVSGLAITSATWLLVILPTNTHTFFYKRQIAAVTKADLENLKHNLLDLPKEGYNHLQDDKAQFESRIRGNLTDLYNEINDPNNRGFSHKGDSINQRISSEMNGTIEMPMMPARISESSIRTWSHSVIERWDEQLKLKMKEYDRKLQQFRDDIDVTAIDALRHELNKAESRIEIMDEPDRGIKNLLRSAHVEVDHLKDLPGIKNLKSGIDNKSISAIDFENVYEVWKLYFAGRFEGQGFTYFIFGTAVVDMIGFLLSYLAFRKEDNY